jgi:hypothetical protein
MWNAPPVRAARCADRRTGAPFMKSREPAISRYFVEYVDPRDYSRRRPLGKAVTFLCGLCLGGMLIVGWPWLNATALPFMLGKDIMSVIGVSTDHPDSAHNADQRVSALLKSAEASLKSNLIDPTSVIFENTRLIEKGGDNVRVCGLIRAKNRYGAYVAPTRFVWNRAKDAALVWTDQNSPAGAHAREEILGSCGPH